ncbi:cache domain-containing protein [Histidinibacterium aquaticum]|uniref:HAMP domain-containing protein n=1 Tax=Histidinibacterium aquaticum TaxID=2613962 RepID=A0A5J5GKM5_9RHOB|nr:cache domain-containing protein [Histidinibacterium aquaticum]KAA9008094.1 hypothetical protein F3S47_11345 [Histidinibacterium aquaticum]
MRVKTPPNLTRIALAGLGLLFLATVFVVLVPLRSQVIAYERTLQAETLTRSGSALRLTVSRAVEREWDSISAVAREIDPEDPRSRQSFVDAAARASQGVAWAGYIGVGGIVEEGSGGQYEGADVSGQSWFRSGLTGGSVSRVQRMGPEGGSANGYVNLSAPVRDDSGEVRGVLVYSLGLNWLRGVMTSAADELQVDMAVVDRTGSLVLSRLGEGPLETRAAEIARLGSPVERLEEGSDGERYLLRAFPEFIVGDMPPFDWSLVVEVPAAPAGAGLGPFLATLQWSGVALLSIVAAAAALFVSVFLRPVIRLAREAERIARGEDLYPTENRSSEESQRLSSALPLIQSRLHGRRPSPAE